MELRNQIKCMNEGPNTEKREEERNQENTHISALWFFFWPDLYFVSFHFRKKVASKKFLLLASPYVMAALSGEIVFVQKQAQHLHVSVIYSTTR